MRFGYNVDRHGKHSGQKVRPKRGRVPIEGNLLVALVAEELVGTLVKKGWARLVPGLRIFGRLPIHKGPETKLEALDNGGNESRVRVTM